MPEILEVSQLLPIAYEPKRQNKWVLEWDGIDAYTIKTFARPQMNLNEIVIDYINMKRYYTGKFEFQTASFTLVDPIAPSQAQKVMEWVRLAHENMTGRDGYKEFYTAKNFKLKLLDPPGAVVELWDFTSAFPTSVNFGSLDYSSAEVATVEVTIRFDGVELMF